MSAFGGKADIALTFFSDPSYHFKDFHLLWHFPSWAGAIMGRETQAAIGHSLYGGQVAPKMGSQKRRQ
jgi:hypothetical protein